MPLAPQSYIIVGQGIAGSLIAWELLKAEQNVHVIDNGHKTSASKIAAGMWNPILFKKLKKSWRADELIPALHRTYDALQEELGIRFKYDRDIIRLFPSNDAANDFHIASGDPKFQDYLSTESQPAIEALANDQFGYGTVKGGYVDLPVFLSAFRTYLEEKKAFLRADFTEEELELTENGVQWRDHQADKIIYANGFKSIESAYWNKLPLSRTHGNLLHVELEDISFQGVFNNGQWLLEQEDGSFKMGATFEWHLTEPTPLEESKQKLISKLESGLKEKPDLKLLHHHAGIRPTTSDHRPIIGKHPNHEQLVLFNGMGTKGVMLAPFFAVRLAEHLVNGRDLDEAVDLGRFREQF